MNRGPRSAAAVLLAALMLLGAIVACSGLTQSTQNRQLVWTPAPVTTTPQFEDGQILPASPTAEAYTTLGTPDIPLATDIPTTTALPTLTPAPTLDPHRVVITEQDIANVIATGAVENAGVHVANPRVRFTGGKTWITADQASYSLISVQNLTVVGRLVAQDGALQLETESVSPQGIIGAMIPGLINQAFRQYTSQWYVENVQTLEGYIELRIR